MVVPKPSKSRSAPVPEVHADPNDFLSQEIMAQIVDAIEGHEPTAQVLYTQDKHNLQVMGESFRGEVFKVLSEKYRDDADEEIDRWFSGVLLPEPTNPYDAHAVMVILLDPENDDGAITPLHVGYLDKEHAAKVQPKIINFWKDEKVIPLLLRVHGGTSERPNFSVFAMAMTSAIRL